MCESNSLGLIGLDKWMTENNCKARVSIHRNRSDFWWTKEERQSASNVATGYCFISGVNGKSAYPMIIQDYLKQSQCDVKNIYVDIVFDMSNESAAKIVTSKLDLTANPMGEYHSPWMFCKNAKRMPVTYGVYKPEGFNEAYLENKKIKPNLSLLSFASKGQITPTEFEEMKVHFRGKREKWDTDVVDIRVFDDVRNLFHKFTEYEEVDSGISTVTLSLIGPDISKNLDYIKGVLSAHC